MRLKVNILTNRHKTNFAFLRGEREKHYVLQKDFRYTFHHPLHLGSVLSVICFTAKMEGNLNWNS